MLTLKPSDILNQQERTSGLKGTFLGGQYSSCPVQGWGRLGECVQVCWWHHRLWAAAATCVGAGNLGTQQTEAQEHRQGCGQRNCWHCEQLQMFKNCELGLGVLGFGVCECTAAAANGSPLFWEGQLRFSCTLAPGKVLRSTCYHPTLPL